MVMISDYCKMEGEGLLETAKGKLHWNLREIIIFCLCLWRETPLEIEKDRINLLKNKVGEAICCLNDVANGAEVTDELNISLI